MFMEIVFFIVLTLLLAISAGFGTNAAVRVTGISNYKTNQDLLKAHSKLTWLSVVAWIGVALIITGIILIFVFDLEMASNIFIYGLMILVFVLLLIIGIFSAWAASLIASADVTDDNKARRQAIISASLAFFGVALVIFGIIMKVFVGDKKDKKSGGDLSGLLGKAELSEDLL